jgi:hypothetical protein
MFIVILLSALAILAIAATLRALGNDGYRQIPTDPTRLP